MSIRRQQLYIDDGMLVSTNLVYAWVHRDPPRKVLYVGATGLPLGARTWLHLNHDDPEIGRIRASHPDALTGPVDVIGFELDEALDRAAVKAAVIALLNGSQPVADIGDAELAAAKEIVADLGELTPS